MFAPFMSLYNPLGTLARSLPPLDPAQFGLPTSIMIYDPEEQVDADDKRSASRARRPPAKGREPGEAGDEGDGQSGSNLANGKSVPGADAPPARDRNPSPRKRRGGAAGKRKRRDADDGDPLFPPPPKRTRNPRGSAANRATPSAPSPLVTAALPSDPAASNGGEDEPGAEETAPDPRRGARTRKPRPQSAKRRDSTGSATTATSVSVSIAAVTKTKTSAEVPPHVGVERREEEEGRNKDRPT